MCKVADKEFLEKLHLDYYSSVDDKERVVLRNAILANLYPLIEGAVRKLSNGQGNADMFQYLTEKVLSTFIPAWKPTDDSTEGYYRFCLYNRGLVYLRQEELKGQREINKDPTDSSYWDSLGIKNNAVVVDIAVKGVEGNTAREAYIKVVSLLEKGHVVGGRSEVVTSLEDEFGLTHSEALTIYTHALISCREEYYTKIDPIGLEIDPNSYFGRLTHYLEDEQIETILKVFGGVRIWIPNGKEQ